MERGISPEKISMLIGFFPLIAAVAYFLLVEFICVDEFKIMAGLFVI